MKLRKLKERDTDFMLEWMHDKSIVEDLQTDFLAKTREDCIRFIDNSEDISENLHLAIADDNDTYMGTVSLRNINNSVAEFAITVRTIAMGRGYSKYAMGELINIAFTKLNLKEIYWCVDSNNQRARKFYDKNGYKRVNINDKKFYEKVKKLGNYTNKQIDSFIWYSIKNAETSYFSRISPEEKGTSGV